MEPELHDGRTREFVHERMSWPNLLQCCKGHVQANEAFHDETMPYTL